MKVHFWDFDIKETVNFDYQWYTSTSFMITQYVYITYGYKKICTLNVYSNFKSEKLWFCLHPYTDCWKSVSCLKGLELGQLWQLRKTSTSPWICVHGQISPPPGLGDCDWGLWSGDPSVGRQRIRAARSRKFPICICRSIEIHG